MLAFVVHSLELRLTWQWLGTVRPKERYVVCKQSCFNIRTSLFWHQPTWHNLENELLNKN